MGKVRARLRSHTVGRCRLRQTLSSHHKNSINRSLYSSIIVWLAAPVYRIFMMRRQLFKYQRWPADLAFLPGAFCLVLVGLSSHGD